MTAPAAALVADLLAKALRHHHAGRLATAEALYRQVLTRAPDTADAWHLRGVAASQAGRATAALPWLRRALVLAPALPDAAYNLALALDDSGDGAAAETVFRLAVAVAPRDARVRRRQALLAEARHGPAAAVALLRAAAPALADRPTLWGALGAALLRAGQPEEAIAVLTRARAAAPADAAVWANLGAAWRALDRPGPATTACRAAIALDPGLAAAHANLARLTAARGAAEAALAGFEAALRLGVDDRGATLTDAVMLARQACDFDRAARWTVAAARLVADGGPHQLAPFALLLGTDDPALQLAAARGYVRGLFGPTLPTPTRRPPARPTAADAPLVIGYLSADFHQHPTAELVVELFERHDRRRVRVHAYSTGPDDGSELRHRLTGAVDRFVDLSALDDTAAAARIAADQVALLVDLKGHTANARPGIPVRRPAPVQLHHLGYPGPLGAPYLDYVIGDPVVAPPQASAWFDACLIRLPDCYQPNDRGRAVVPLAETPSRRALGLPDAAVVLCCFNNTTKITPEVFQVWLSLLHRLPEAVLWLLDTVAAAGTNLRLIAAAAGVDPARLVVAARRPAAQYRALYRRADLFLDTAPYTGHTTASDALWLGLPVLTCPGQTMASRVAASLLTAAGLPELIMPSWTAYEDTAVALARDPAARAALAARLAQARTVAPLFDTDRFARALERAYACAWRDHGAGRAPRAIGPEELT